MILGQDRKKTHGTEAEPLAGFSLPPMVQHFLNLDSHPVMASCQLLAMLLVAALCGAQVPMAPCLIRCNL